MSTIDNEIRELLKISCYKKKKLAVSQDYSHLYTDEYCQQLLEDIAAECRTLNIYKSNLDDCLKESKFLSAEDVYLNMLRSLLIADTGIQKHAIPRIWLPIVEEKLRCNEIDNNVKMSVKFTRDEYIDFIKKIRASLIMKNTRQMCRKIIVFFHDPFDQEVNNISVQADIVLAHLEKLGHMLNNYR